MTRQRPGRPAWGWLALGLAVAAAAPLVWLWTAPEPHRPSVLLLPAPGGPAAPAASPTPVPAPVSAVGVLPAATSAPITAPTSRQRDPNADPTPDLADYLNPGEKPTMAEVIARLHQAGVTSGLGAFQPPGTRPPLIGLAVPPDYVLPPGFVRHHQATDDGQRIEPILMFAPDLQLFDSAGRPVPMPADRVVPPELAPPGLPIRRIVVPAPADPRK